MKRIDSVLATELKDCIPSWPQQPKARADAPNVVMVVLDDVGFGQLGCYGSDIRTPRMDQLAAGGLRLRQFNTTGICSATRACLLTGRNHHVNHMGAIAELATGFPGYDFYMPKENGTMAEILVEEGYATMAVGKWHLTPAEEHTLGAPRKRWPLGRGFERFYGFHGSDTSQYHPDLVCDNHQVQRPDPVGKEYHLSEDLTDKAIEFVRDVHNAAPGKPFFMYFAFGAMHTPLHVPTRYADRYKGQFHRGWEVWREEVYQRQLEGGMLPPGTQLTPKPDWIPAWESLTAAERSVYSRLMEVFAGFLEHTDEQVGRLIDELERMGKLDNTIFVVLSDNGASSEGGMSGMYNNVRYMNGIRDTAEAIQALLPTVGQVESNPHYPYGWAWAGNTPFRRWKQEVHAGGVVDPFIIHWPRGLADTGQIRGQYAHAIDVMPTLLELLGISLPDAVAGIDQARVQGVSFAKALQDGQAEPAPRTQYFEMRGCRALYDRGWKAVAYHPRLGLAWDGSDPNRPYSQDKWELYHIDRDFSEMEDVADRHPEKLRDLIDLWWSEAGRNNVLPLDNRGVARLSLRKPVPYELGSRHTLYRSKGTIREFGAMDLKNRAHALRATLEITSEKPHGVVLSMGTGYGGYALFVVDGVAMYVHNYAALAEYTVRADRPLPKGRCTLDVVFTKTGEHAGQVLILIDGEPAGAGVIEKTLPFYFGGAEMAVGHNPGYAVSGQYRALGSFEFSDEILQVVLEAESQPRDEDALQRIAMAIQ